ncbi:hypothetical protein TGPRC2_312820 [Toxoplasma gondii TgCatPRC2]|uniref:Uncharacterized protein n=1 Tax=Toxoplasma gondii TgCatPRC2 TaxID=1130821 RepID=A0A151H867_TOXGO|nr:hypothetical protein TGPRC2_312820 [Toxoplasma gondii TgCatPRC2]
MLPFGIPQNLATMGADLNDFFGVMDTMLLDYGAELTAPRLSLEFNIGAALASKLLRLYIYDKLKQRKAASEQRVRLLLKFAAALGDCAAEAGRSVSAVLCDFSEEPFSARCPAEPWCLYSVVRLPPASADGSLPPSSKHAQWQEEVRSLLPHFASAAAAASNSSSLSASKPAPSPESPTKKPLLYIPPFAAIRQPRLVGRVHRCSGAAPSPAASLLPARGSPQTQRDVAVPAAVKTAGLAKSRESLVQASPAAKSSPGRASETEQKRGETKIGREQKFGGENTTGAENKRGGQTQSTKSLLARFGFGTTQTLKETVSPRETVETTSGGERRGTGQREEAGMGEMDDSLSAHHRRKRPLEEGSDTRDEAGEDGALAGRPVKKTKQVSKAEETRMQWEEAGGEKTGGASAGDLFDEGEWEEDKEREGDSVASANLRLEEEGSSNAGEVSGEQSCEGQAEEDSEKARGRGNKKGVAPTRDVEQMECEEKTIVLKEKTVETRTYRDGDYLVLQDEDVVKDKEVTVRTLRPSNANSRASGSEASDASAKAKRRFGAAAPKKKQGNLMAFFQKK